MQIHVFTDQNEQDGTDAVRATAGQVLQRVAEGTDAERLVVAVYFLENSAVWQGELTSRKLVRRDAFASNRRRRWFFTRRFPAPEDIPESFALVRVALGARWHRKMVIRDRNGHVLKFGCFEDHLAFLFAHELHHFRRHFLGQHQGEGEISADRWAIQRVTSIGHSVEVTSIKRRRSRVRMATTRIPSGRNTPLLQRVKARAANLGVEDLRNLAGWIGTRIGELHDAVEHDKWEQHYDLLRGLPTGAKLQVTQTNFGMEDRVGQVWTKVRTLKRSSRRLAVHDQTGKLWHWPMRWLQPYRE